MAKDYIHKARVAPSETSFYGKIDKDMDIDEALDKLSAHRVECMEASWRIARLMSNNDRLNPYQQLQAFRKYAPILVKNFYVVYALAHYFSAQVEVLEERSTANKNKRWTKEEEEEVIDMVCDGCTELEIAIKTGRSIGAVHTKISNLVGLQRERNIEGNFSGTVNGELIEGKLKGKIKKERT